MVCEVGFSRLGEKLGAALQYNEQLGVNVCVTTADEVYVPRMERDNATVWSQVQNSTPRSHAWYMPSAG